MNARQITKQIELQPLAEGTGSILVIGLTLAALVALTAASVAAAVSPILETVQALV